MIFYTKTNKAGLKTLQLQSDRPEQSFANIQRVTNSCVKQFQAGFIITGKNKPLYN